MDAKGIKKPNIAAELSKFSATGAFEPISFRYICNNCDIEPRFTKPNSTVMNDRVITVAGFSYKISKGFAMKEANEGEYVLCLDEARDNALPENKNSQVPVIYQWVAGNNCNGCRKILETNDPELVQKGIRKIQISL